MTIKNRKIVAFLFLNDEEKLKFKDVVLRDDFTYGISEETKDFVFFEDKRLLFVYVSDLKTGKSIMDDVAFETRNFNGKYSAYSPERVIKELKNNNESFVISEQLINELVKIKKEEFKDITSQYKELEKKGHETGNTIFFLKGLKKGKKE